MSLQTWLEEFYPKEAKDTTPKEAIAHSLQKWKGTTPENLAKHLVIKQGVRLIDADLKFEKAMFTGKECALCVHYAKSYCGKCPLAISRNGTPCDEGKRDILDLYWLATGIVFDGNKTQPMIDALQSLLK